MDKELYGADYGHGNYVVVDPPLDHCNCNVIDLENPPMVSFCIPIFNSSRTLENCLQSIENQIYPQKEIVIVDNGSSDHSLKIAEKYTDKIFFDDGLLGSVRQTTLEHSTGEIIALFDSDIIIPHKNWLKNSIKYFNYSENVSTVWPSNVAPPRSSWTTHLYFNLWKMSMENRIKKGKSVFGGGNALFLRKYLNEIGGINTSLHWGEDFDWAHKLKNRGYKVVAINDPLYHDTMPNLSEFTKKQFTAADSFTKEGLDLMGLSKWDLFYENVILGSKNMLNGIIIGKDLSWTIYPLFVVIRGLGYSYNVIKNL